MWTKITVKISVKSLHC